MFQLQTNQQIMHHHRYRRRRLQSYNNNKHNTLPIICNLLFVYRRHSIWLLILLLLSTLIVVHIRIIHAATTTTIENVAYENNNHNKNENDDIIMNSRSNDTDLNALNTVDDVVNDTCSNNNNNNDDITTTSDSSLNGNNNKDKSSVSSIFEQILANTYDDDDSNSDDNDNDINSSTTLTNHKFDINQCIHILKERNAHHCWHKHSTFLDHLVGVYNILRLWNQSTIISFTGLFHSAYSNSYVNLALFNPKTERSIMQQLIGINAEEMVYIFCNINRQDIVVNTLLQQKYIPINGLYVPHLHQPNTTIYLSSQILHTLLIFSMADIADQYFGWQDLLFGGGGMNGSMILPQYDIIERHDTKVLWPGISKPGLWMNYVSELAYVANTVHNHPNTSTTTTTSSIVTPPVFDYGTKVISIHDEKEARDLYWNVVIGTMNDENEMIQTLQTCIMKNPYIFEPLVMLAQLYAHENNFTYVLYYTNHALQLQMQWGTAWDKRLSFQAWVAWTKVIQQHAEQQKPWPTNSWDVNNFGFVY